MLIELSVQEIVSIYQRQDEDAKGQITARARRQNAGRGGWTPWKQNTEDRRRAPPFGLFGETSISDSNMPTTCAERANPTHTAMEMGALAVTPSALHREHRIYSNGIITFYNQDLGADANIPSRQWQKFSLSRFLGMTEYTLTGFRIFQHRLKGAVLHHDFTTAPFHSYHNIPDDRHKRSRGSCIILLRLILAFLLEKCWLTNNGRPTV